MRRFTLEENLKRTVKQCRGFKRDLKRCLREGDWRFYCDDHKYQPLIILFVVVFTVLPALFSYHSYFSKKEFPEIKPESLIMSSEPSQDEIVSELDKELNFKQENDKKKALKEYFSGISSFNNKDFKDAT